MERQAEAEMETLNARELIARCLDGTATDLEAAELSRLVARDPELARQLALEARLESRLEVLVRGEPDRSAAPASLSRRWRIGLSSAGGALAAATAVLAVIWFRAPARPPTDEVAAAPPASHAPESPGRLTFADGSVAELWDARSRVAIRRSTPRAVEVDLLGGRARFEVVPRQDRRFRVWVGSAYVEVLGTVFSVERSDNDLRVSVERGKVKVVSGGGEERLLPAGAAAVVALKGEAAAAAPERARPATRAEERARPAPARDEVGALLHASEKARRDGNPEQALALLQRLLDRHAGDPRAPYAAFILGRVLLEELNRPREAALAFGRVAALDPKTPLLQDALAREVESWWRSGDGYRARARARAYLDRYPNGPRAEEVRRYSRME